MRVPDEAGSTDPATDLAQRDAVDRLTEELAAARAALNRLEQLFNVVPVGVVSYDRRGQIEFVNQRVHDVTGTATGEEFTALENERVHADDRPQIANAADMCIRGEIGRFRVRLDPNGPDVRHIEGSIVPIYRDGRQDGAVTLLRDVTDEIRQGELTRLFKAIADATTDIVGISSLDGQVVYLNRSGHEFFGVSDGKPLHLTELFEQLSMPNRRLLLQEAYPVARRGGVWQGELELVRGCDSARIPMSAVVVGVRDERNEIVALTVTYRDLSERTKLEAELAHAAAHDPLTGLTSRQELFVKLESCLAAGSPTAVLFFDLDDFKIVNDSLGHAAGDQVLSQLAGRIREAARETDVVGRLGGDEFLVICPGVSTAEEANVVADRILTNLRQPMVIGTRRHVVTGSIGIAMSSTHGESAANLIQEADIAMYQAKRAGRRQSMLFTDSMRAEAVGRLELERELRLALERDEFQLYFQPLIYFGGSTVQDFEALIRWQHPRLGLLEPSDFLPLVDSVGLNGQVGRWAFTVAAHAAAAMRLIEPAVAVGVNVHPDQIRQPGFVDEVVRCMDAAQITGDALAIEITEHAVMVDVEQTRSVLEELRTIGVSVAIDDFGTGYSNLDLLRRLPVDYLKIDRSFVAGLGIEPGDTQLVRMIVGLSSELGIKVIAEGVETQIQADELLRLGCDIGQGFLFSNPLTFDEAIQLLRDQRGHREQP